MLQQKMFGFAFALGLSVFTTTAPASTLSDLEAARFLLQSTLGFNQSMVNDVQFTGKKEWIKSQADRPASYLQPYLLHLRKLQIEHLDMRFDHQFNSRKSRSVVGKRNISTTWLRSVLNGNDALRQKVAWALSQILVVSNESSARTIAAASYYDLLLEHAFGRYEELLKAVTWHPMMGHYLSYLGNEKADPKRNQFPDENYAREVMQLFTIGLWELNQDGTYRLNETGDRIPTYTIEDIEVGARVFTGFKLASNTGVMHGRWERFLKPMRLDEKRHDKSEKRFFGGRLVLSGGQSARADINGFLQALANHPNTAPFVSRRLIQQMVTSNPSPGYVGRVSSIWRNSNGHLGDVVSAILLDPEARNADATTGKLRDPLSRVVQIIKAFGCYDAPGLESNVYPGLQWWRPELSKVVGQEPMRADSVFSFFEPEYSKPGTMQRAGIVGPEFQILDEVTSVGFVNYIWSGLRRGFHLGRTYKGEVNSVTCELPTLANENQIAEFLGRANLMLAAGSLTHESIRSIAARVRESVAARQRAAFAVTLIASSPESAILR